MPEGVAGAFARAFDGNKDVELILSWYESSIKSVLPTMITYTVIMEVQLSYS